MATVGPTGLVSVWTCGGCRAERLAALTSFLKAVPSADVAPSSIGSVVVDDTLVKLIEEEVMRTNVSDAAGFVVPCCFTVEKYFSTSFVCCNYHIYVNYHTVTSTPFPQIDIIGAVVIVWRVRGKTIRSVLCNIVCNDCAQCDTHTYEQTNSYLDWVLSHWAHFTVLRFIFVLCITVCCMHA